MFENVFENVLRDQNKHWSGNRYPSGAKRECFSKLLQFLKTEMIVSILGVRRSGKSTLLKQLINHLIEEKVPPQNIVFLNLEVPFFKEYSQDVKYLEKVFEVYLKIANPKGKIYCFLDEVQFFSDWQLFVKAHYEQRNVQFVITGSNSNLLSSDLMTLLTGRTLPIEVYPLSFKELARYHQIETESKSMQTRFELERLFEEYLHYGGFPGIVIDGNFASANEILSSHIKTVLYQDVLPRLHTRAPGELEHIFVSLISNVGSLFSYHKLSKQFDISDKSLKEYIKLFSDAYLLFELNFFSYSHRQLMRNPKKIYSIDSGHVNVAAYKFTENLGKLLENFVFLEFKRLGLELFYYKTNSDQEVDFLVKNKNLFALVQVVWQLENQVTKERELKALTIALEELKIKNALIITQSEGGLIEVGGYTIHVVPAYKFACLDQDRKLALLFRELIIGGF